jgi:NitT/TauT family transport system substrate-binding protein
MRTSHRIVSTAAAICISAGLMGAAQAEPLRIFYFVWIGYGPLFVAQEKGFFAREGVHVELINNEIHDAAFGGLFTGQADAVAGGLQDAPAYSEPDEEPLVCVLALDDDRGGTGVVATKDIQTIAGLKGKSVAVLRGSIMEFYLSALLKVAGLGQADIDVVDLSTEDSGQAFLLREVDAAVVAEPFLAEAQSAAHAHVLTDTTEQPGLLADCLMTRADVFNDRRDEFRALARAWDAAVRYIETHPDEANEIMARHLGGANEDPTVFAEMLRDVALYDGDDNREYFGTPEKPGPIYRTMQQAIDVWSSIGMLNMQVSPADVIRHGIWDE